MQFGNKNPSASQSVLGQLVLCYVRLAEALLLALSSDTDEPDEKVSGSHSATSHCLAIATQHTAELTCTWQQKAADGHCGPTWTTTKKSCSKCSVTKGNLTAPGCLLTAVICFVLKVFCKVKCAGNASLYEKNSSPSHQFSHTELAVTKGFPHPLRLLLQSQKSEPINHCQVRPSASVSYTLTGE